MRGCAKVIICLRSEGYAGMSQERSGEDMTSLASGRQ